MPLDANRPDSFTELAEKIGHAMDHDHVATVAFAHWPGHTSPYYDDLRRIMAIAPVIGKFVTLDQYFADTDSSGTYARFNPDDYRLPYLQQDVAAGRGDPLARWIRSAAAGRRGRIGATRSTRSGGRQLQGKTVADAAGSSRRERRAGRGGGAVRRRAAARQASAVEELFGR